MATLRGNVRTLITNVASLVASLVNVEGALIKGSEFTIKKTITCSGVPTATPTDITGVSSGGELELQQIRVKTDGTGLAGMTNLNFLTNNVKGLLDPIAAVAASGLGANKTQQGTSFAATALVPTVLESGKKIQIQATGSDGTGAGTIDIYLVFRRLTAGATIAAA